MKAQDLRGWIDSLTQDIEFEFCGKQGVICPFNRQDISLCYDGKEVTVHSVDAAMNEPFILGKSLMGVCEELDI